MKENEPSSQGTEHGGITFNAGGYFNAEKLIKALTGGESPIKKDKLLLGSGSENQKVRDVEHKLELVTMSVLTAQERKAQLQENKFNAAIATVRADIQTGFAKRDQEIERYRRRSNVACAVSAVTSTCLAVMLFFQVQHSGEIADNRNVATNLLHDVSVIEGKVSPGLDSGMSNGLERRLRLAEDRLDQVGDRVNNIDSEKINATSKKVQDDYKFEQWRRSVDSAIKDFQNRMKATEERKDKK